MRDIYSSSLRPNSVIVPPGKYLVKVGPHFLRLETMPQEFWDDYLGPDWLVIGPEYSKYLVYGTNETDLTVEPV